MSIMHAVAAVGADAPPKVVQVGGVDSAGDLRPLTLSGGGFAPPRAGAVTLSNVSSSVSSGTLLAANGDRIGVLVVNDSTAILYLKYGATASASSYSVKMEPGSYWEMPQPIYTGIIDGIWASANGAARITELE